MPSTTTQTFICRTSVRKSISLATHASLNPLRSVRLPIVPVGCWPPYPRSTWTRSFPMPTKKTSTTLLNTSKRKAWRSDGPTNGRCLWELHHVWGWDNVKDQPVVLQENYFSKIPSTGKKVSALLPALIFAMGCLTVWCYRLIGTRTFTTLF